MLTSRSIRAPRAPRAPRASRAGFSLVELMIVVVLLALVMGTMVRVVVRQQRFYRGASDIIDTRSQLRQAVAVLPADLRSLSKHGSGARTAPDDPDLLDMRDSAIDARVSTGTGVLCNSTASGGKDLHFVPATLAKNNGLTSLAGDLPAVGDFVFVFNEGDPIRSSDDQWNRFQLATVTTNVTACVGSPFIGAADATQPRIVATVAGSIPFAITPGTPVRIAKRVRYSLYKAADGKWYLGYRTWQGASWNTIQPVSGPYQPYSTDASQSGLRFAYYDSLGAVTTTRANVARIDIVVRGQTQQPIKIAGFKDGQYRDSLVTRVAIRNRN